MPSSVWRILPYAAAGLLMACQQADAPPAVNAEASVPAPAPAEPEVVLASNTDSRIQVDITYCIP